MLASTVYSILSKKENAHNDPIYCCAWAKTRTCGDTNIPSKEYIVTGGLDTLIKVWTHDNYKLDLQHTLTGHVMAVVSLAVSADGFTLASISLDSTLLIWDLVSGQKIHEIPTEATEVWQVAFSPDGAYVVSGSHSGKITVYGVEKGTTEMVLDTRGKFALSVAWSPDAKYIASGAVDGSVCIFDVAQGKLLHTINAHTKDVKSVGFSPDSRLLVTGSNDGFVKVFEVASANSRGSLEHKSWVISRVSPDGTRVATAYDGNVQIATVDSLNILHTFAEHSNTICDIQFNVDSNKLVSVSKDKSINIYECPVLPKTAANK